MTNQEILAKILHEATGLSSKDIESMLFTCRAMYPDSIPKLDQDLSEQEAEKLLQNLRSEQAGILAWLVRGAVAVHEDIVSGVVLN